VKAFEFRLDQVLKLKRQRERLAELRQKQCLVELEAAQSVVRGFQEMLSGAARRAESQLGAPLAAAAWTAAEEHAVRIGRALEQAEVRRRLAAAKYDEATQALRQLAMEVEALATLRSEQVQAHHLALQRWQQEQLDDLGLRRWLAARAKSPAEP
jgi:flagellar export protein FliJ